MWNIEGETFKFKLSNNWCKIPWTEISFLSNERRFSFFFLSLMTQWRGFFQYLTHFDRARIVRMTGFYNKKRKKDLAHTSPQRSLTQLRVEFDV